jgi:hypothetical protein
MSLVSHLSMKLMVGSKERTEREWHSLLGRAGLKITGIYGRGFWQSIIEAVKI